MILYLHSHDVSDAGRTFGRHSGLPDVRHIVLTESIRPGDVAPLVIRSLGDEANGTVELLIINSHGSPGTLHLGGIEDAAYDINEHNARTFGSSLHELMKPMDRGGLGVELHGCFVAGGRINQASGEIIDEHIGVRFIYALACGFGTRVRASSAAQVSDSEGLFEDSVVDALPSDDEDFTRHVTSNINPDLVQPGGTMTRIEAAWDAFLRDPLPRAHGGETRAPSDPAWARRFPRASWDRD